MAYIKAPVDFRLESIFVMVWTAARFKYRLNTELKIRSANKNDYAEVNRMKNQRTTRFFGPDKLANECEATFFTNHAAHRIIISKWAHTMAYAEFMNYPLIQALPQDSYMDWLNYHFCIQLPLSISNTMFLGYFVFNKIQMPKILFRLLTELFLRERKILYILTVEMPRDGEADIHNPNTPQYFPLEQYSKVYYPRVYNILSCKNTQRIHVIHRDDILSKIRYRHALPEDNDELVEIISADRPHMKEELGDFFIAEQLLREDEDTKHTKIIVTEINLVTMGFFWLNDNIDILSLIINFEVGFFNFLIKFNPDEKYYTIKQEMRQLTKKRYLDLYKESVIDNIFNEYEQNVDTDKANDNFNNTFFKINHLDVVLNNASYYLKPYDETIQVSINVPESMDENEMSLDDLLQAQSNVFAFQFLGFKQNYDLRRLSRILLAMFVFYKDRDYCLISLPRNTTWTAALTEFLKYFIRVIPRPETHILDYVYITHRSTVLGEISVHKITAEDVPQIQNFLKLANAHASLILTNIPDIDPATTDSPLMEDDTLNQIEDCVVKYIMNDVLTNPHTEYTMLTIRCGNSAESIEKNVVIGFVALRAFHHARNLTYHFQLPQIEVQELHQQGEILLLKIPALYHYQAHEIFRSIAHISGYSFLISLQSAKDLTNDLTKEMQPVEPRAIKNHFNIESSAETNKTPSDKNCELEEFDIFQPLDFTRGKFSVYIQNLLEYNYFGNVHRIIILGFTDVTKAFLRKLIFNWNGMDDRYTSAYCCIPRLRITVIANPGEVEAYFQGIYPCKHCADPDECWVNYENSCSYVRDCTLRMDLRRYVYFISGHVKCIDREKNYVILTNDCQYYYHNLLLFCSTEFGPPIPLANEEIPLNYAHFNTRSDRVKMYHKLRLILKNETADFRFVIYGAQLNVYSFIDFLLTHGVQPEAITLVVPHRQVDAFFVQTLNDPYIDYKLEEACEDMVEDMGVKVLRHQKFIEWHFHEGTQIIKKAIFQKFPSDDETQLLCDFFASFNPCHMNDEYNKILDHADIGLDEADYIVVDANYRTNDAKVLAGSHNINMQNYTGNPNFQYLFVNHKEQAEKIMRSLDIAHIHTTSARKYSQPAYFQVNLPLKHSAVKVTIPKKFIANRLPNELSQILNTYNDGIYTRIRINDDGIVEEILVANKLRDKSFDFLQHFCGKHEALLNNLLSRWCYGEIPCLFTFLTEPWTELLMHEHFAKLRAQNMQIMMNSFKSIFMRPLSRNERMREVKALGKCEHVPEKLENNLVEFLRTHREDFTQPFALPEDYV